MKTLFIIDHPENLNIATDSSMLLISACKKRGANVVTCQPEDIFYDEEVKAVVQGRSVNMLDFNVIFIRQDPPFDSAYLTCTYLLEMVSGKVLIINNPTSIRNYTEKLSSLYFAEYMPKTIVSRNMDIISGFMQQYKEAVIKPLYSAAGKNIAKITLGDFQAKAEELIKICNDQIMVQEFLPSVYQGDKRIFIVFGKIIGFYKRVPAAGEILANQAQGGTVVATQLTKREQEIAGKVAGFLLENKIYLAGIDMIDEKLTEINITSPTGLVAINQLFDIKAEDIILDDVFNLYNSMFLNP